MCEEAGFIARLEAADTDELREFLRQPTKEEQKALRAYFGERRYQRLHSRALRSSARRSLGEPDQNVVVLHGIMGSELSSYARSAAQRQIWVKVVQIIAGELEKLRLGEDGRSGLDPSVDIRPSGIMKRHYGELLLSLSERWRVRAFWYDWRKDVSLAAAELDAQIRNQFADDAPVHLVAHSMGGLVARTFVKNYPERWATMWDADGNGRRGGRLIMLGTPNHGSFVIPQVITGIEGFVRKLALLDLTHSPSELLEILNSFPGLYQMLPSPLLDGELEKLYESKTYGEHKVSQGLLDGAAAHHAALADVVDPDRMVYVAGANRPTLSGISDFAKLSSVDGYEVTTKGDGRVAHALGALTTRDGRDVPSYYVDEAHGDLAANERVLSALGELLETGATTVLPQKPPSRRRLAAADGSRRDGADPRRAIEAMEREDLDHLQAFAARVRARGAQVRSQDGKSTFYSSSQERAIEEILTRGFLTVSDEDPTARVMMPPFPPAQIEIALLPGRLESVHERDDLGGVQLDAVAVGHYIGVKPQAAELALDEAISEALPEQQETGDGLLTQFADRGIIYGERGQIFFLPDPRDETANGRLVAVVGMGYPGRFGVPELTLAARELCWTLGRMGRRHLATVLIGAGNNNIPASDAVEAWIRGVKHALTGSQEDEKRRLRRITFVEEDPRKLRKIDKAIWSAKRRLEDQERLHIVYRPIDEALSKEEHDRLREAARRRARKEAESALDSEDEREATQPTRVTLALEGNTYRFGAITESASLPERAVKLDPKLVHEANDELAAEWRSLLQQERGRLMERLLIPEDLRPHLASKAPLVMVLDSTTAQIHWEMVAQTVAPTDWPSEVTPSTDELPRTFLGTSRGFTRQLLTPFAPAPQPPPPPRRLLRVLVVADPAEGARLPGAEEEGVEIADLFESFNEVWGDRSESRVEVVRLLGPSEATRTHVLRHLMLRSYDLLHFAGHCVYDESDPERQGWVFANGDEPILLSPNELNRIDRIPKFVFSNACESGITPDRAEERTAALAPGFAESFFARGVANFVCTAWPVDDGAARKFALELYSHLLGLEPDPNHSGRFTPGAPKPMHDAMREARLAIFGTVSGARTWGAYQHYGNPYFHLFDPRTIERGRERRSRSRTARPAASAGAQNGPSVTATLEKRAAGARKKEPIGYQRR